MIYHKEIGQGPALVLLHGFGFHSGVWQGIIPDLQKDFSLHLIDLPGFGLSRDIFFPNTLLDLVRQLLLVLPKQAIYCGSSLGGFIAMALAIEAPQRVQKLITVGSTPRFLQTEHWRGVSSNDFQQFYLTIKKDPQRGLKRFLMMLMSESERGYLVDLVKEMFQYGIPSEQTLLSALLCLREGDLRAQLSSLRCESLHLVGEHDPLTPIHALWTQTIIPAAGHLPFITQQQIFLSYLREFIHD